MRPGQCLDGGDIPLLLTTRLWHCWCGRICPVHDDSRKQVSTYSVSPSHRRAIYSHRISATFICSRCTEMRSFCFLFQFDLPFSCHGFGLRHQNLTATSIERVKCLRVRFQTRPSLCASPSQLAQHGSPSPTGKLPGFPDYPVSPPENPECSIPAASIAAERSRSRK